MNVILEVNYIRSLVSTVLSRVSDVIEVRKGHKPSTPDDVTSEYAEKIRDELKKFDQVLITFKEHVVPSLNDRQGLEDIYLMLSSYFKLIESLLYFVLAREGGLELKLIKRVLSMFEGIAYHISNYAEEKETSVPNFADSYLTHIIELRALLENEIQITVANVANSIGISRIDTEIDKVKLSIKSEVNEISMAYSDGRAQLLSAIEECKNNLDTLQNSAKNIIDYYKVDIDTTRLEIEKRNGEIEESQRVIESCIARANGMLEKTSQAGMASAFQRRYNALWWPVIFWALAFFACLVGITPFGHDFIKKIIIFSSGADVKAIAENNASWLGILSSLALSFPFVWGAWFSAKQYSHASQLRVDYAYKVAIAMTYHGFKGEAGNVDDKMSEKLLDSIVSQFSENPVRLYQNSSDASIIEAVLKNDKLSDILNVIKK